MPKIPMRSFVIPGLIIAALAASFAPSAHAELPKDAYLKMQQEAAEFVHIEIVGVQKTSQTGPERRHVEVVLTAIVKRVERTAAGLRPGTCIRVIYRHRTGEPMPGASEIPILKCGKTYPAFLKRGDKPDDFKPVAGGYSFNALKDERKAT